MEDSSKKRAILLAVCGSKTFQLIRSLTEEDPTSKPYDDVVQLVTDYYDPKPSVIVQRYKFNSRVRGTDENISTYVAALRQLAEHCNYRNTLSEMLRDRLVCGINHPAIQKTLLAEKDLTLDKALDIARALEAAEKGTKDLKVEVTPPVSSSYFVSQSYYRRPPPKTLESTRSHKPCYRCGGPHLPSTCKCKDWECFNCKKKGHIASVCKSKKTVRRVPVEKTYRLKVILLPRKFVHTRVIQGLKNQIHHTQCSMLETVQWNQLLLTLS